MTLIVADLSRDITIGGVSLNNVSDSNVLGIDALAGNRVDYCRIGPADVVQFTEKLALANGLDYGPVYLGGLSIEVRGVSFGATRSAAENNASAIEAVVRPATGGFGLVTFTWKDLVDGSHSLSVRPNGLIVPAIRGKQGGNASDPIGIEWQFTALAMNPTVS